MVIKGSDLCFNYNFSTSGWNWKNSFLKHVHKVLPTILCLKGVEP